MSGTEICIPKNLPVLKDLDTLLRCGICYEYMKTTMITNCSHNYCSLCIRKSLMYKGQCPACFEEAFDSQLRNNKIVDEFILIFSTLSSEIQKMLNNSDQLQHYEIKNNNITDRNRSEIDGKLPVPEIEKKVSESPSKPSTSFFTSKLKNSPQASKVLSKTVKQIPSIFTPRKTNSIKPNVVTTPVNLVPCPVCTVDIPERNINLHLDACLKRSETQQESSPKQVQRRKPLPKLVYPLLQDKELKKKLKDQGLSINGDRTALIARHQRFTLLYNSECDNENPRSVADIIQQIEREEKEEKKNAGISNILKIDRKTDPKLIEQAQHQYLQQNKQSFADLIKSIRNRTAEKKPSAKRNIITSDNEGEGTSETVKLHKESQDQKSFTRNDISDDDETDIDDIPDNANHLKEIDNMDEIECESDVTEEPTSPVLGRNTVRTNPISEREGDKSTNGATYELTPDLFVTPQKGGSDAESNDSFSILTQRTPEEMPCSDPSSADSEQPVKKLSSQVEDPDFDPEAEVDQDFEIKKRPMRNKRKIKKIEKPSTNEVVFTEARSLRKRVKH